MPSKQGQQTARKVGSAMSPGQANQLAKALDLADAYYGPVRDAWASATPAQREAYLTGSPLLARLLAFAAAFSEVR